MVYAGVLIKTKPGKTKDVLGKVRKIDGARNVIAVFGRYDIVAMIEARDLDTLANTVVSKIGKIDGVINTETLIAVEIS